MTIAERIEKIKQAKVQIDEVLDDIDQDANMSEELGEIYHLLISAKVPLHKAHLRFKQERSRQPLGVI